MRSALLVAPVAIGVLLAGSTAGAEGRHKVERGETLEHVAHAHGCPVDAVLRANHLNTTLVRAGTIVYVPSCTIRARARTREQVRQPETDDERARRALAVIDGDSRVKVVERAPVIAARRVEPSAGFGGSQSVGTPWQGKLRGGAAFPDGDGYWVRRPDKAFGATHVVEGVRRAIAEVRKTYSDVHTLAIGDLSAPHGGPIGRHVSHQSGLDVDIGFYFVTKPSGYPETFVTANGDLDLEATWALIEAFASTAGSEGGVQVIFLDHAVQGRLHRWAKSEGIAADKLSAILQYPRGADTQAGIVRHWPSHADHIHVRFKPR